MELRIVAVGEQPPRWVSDGVQEYTRRMPRQLRTSVTTVRAATSKGNDDIKRQRADEGRRLLKASEGCRRIALDEGGKAWDTPGLARRLDDWLMDGADVALLIGGADGLDPACLEGADHRWSLSALTLPHMLVRVIVAEQLYRAWTVLNNHPYHRG